MDRDATWCKAVLMVGLALSSSSLLLAGLLYATASGTVGHRVGSFGVWVLIGTPLVALIVSGAVRDKLSLVRASAVLVLIAAAVIAEVLR